MLRKMITGVVAAVVGALLLCGGGLAAIITGPGGTACPGAPPTISPPPGGWQPAPPYDAEQVGHVATIASVGAAKNVPVRGWIIAVATAIQESGLRNVPGGDRDSIGLFQQRPSQGWGTPQQLRDPVYAAAAFYRTLLTVPGWQRMSLTEAAQKVQRSAYPDAYAAHEPDARMLITHVTGISASSDGPLLVCAGATGPWTAPVDGPVVSEFRTRERPGHDGVDLSAGRGRPIKAASAGTVTVATCNISRGHSCDVDGSPGIGGCGWYVDIDHGAGIVTRYCHMLTRPSVAVGQPVTVGEVIGLIGSSGNSSGPHLHFEVHQGTPTPTPTDPIVFMASRGAPLQ